MHIIAKKEILSDYINIVSRAMPAKSPKEILNGILIRASEDGRLEFAATNTEFAISANAAECDTWEPGAVVLPPKFVQVVKLLPSQIVKIQSNPQEAQKCCLHISSGDASFTLVGMEPDHFPQVPKELKELHFQLKSQLFKELLNNTLFATAVECHNPIFEGVCIEAKDGQLFAIGSDTYRIALQTTPIEAPDFKAVIPARILNEINKIITDPNEVVSCYVSDREIRIAYKGYIISSRILAGDYPNFFPVFPQDNKTTIIIKTKELKDIITRALLISHKIKISVKDDSMVVSAKAQDGTLEEVVQAENISGEELEVFFNAHYISDIFRVVTDDTITLNLNGPLGPCLIEQGNFKYLILPIRP